MAKYGKLCVCCIIPILKQKKKSMLIKSFLGRALLGTHYDMLMNTHIMHSHTCVLFGSKMRMSYLCHANILKLSCVTNFNNEVSHKNMDSLAPAFWGHFNGQLL